MAATRKQRERAAYDARVRSVIESGKSALISMPDFGTILHAVCGALSVEFTEKASRRSAHFQDFAFSDTIYVRGMEELQTGWCATLFFAIDQKINPALVLKALERYGIYGCSGDQGAANKGQQSHHRFNVYILSDDFSTMAVIRRLAGQDVTPGPTSCWFPKSIMSL